MLFQICCYVWFHDISWTSLTSWYFMDVMPKNQPGFSSCLGGSSSLSRSEKMDQLDEMISFQGRTDFLNDTHVNVNILEVSPRSFLTNLTGSYLNIVTPRLAEKMRCVHHCKILKLKTLSKKNLLFPGSLFSRSILNQASTFNELVACCESFQSFLPRLFGPDEEALLLVQRRHMGGVILICLKESLSELLRN